MSPPPERGVSDEVTRVQAVEYLQGMTGHAVGSLASLLLCTAGYLGTNEIVFAFGGLVCGFLVTANGLSIYFWDFVQGRILSRETHGVSDNSGRTLAPSMSNEHKAELTAGFIQIVGLVVAVSFAVVVIRWLGTERGSYLLGGLLGASNVGMLAASRLRS